jgi:hypothetical protein
MKYVFGVTKRVNYSKSKNITKQGRKYFFSYEFDVENSKFKRVRISTIKAIYYKITFIFGLKAKKITNVYCQDCKKSYNCIVNFWDKNTDCPDC